MAKVPFSDVVPPDKRTIRNIQINRSSKRKSPVIIKPEEDLGVAQFSNIESPVTTKISSFETAEVRKGPAYEYYYPKNAKAEATSVKAPISGFSDGGRQKRLVFSGAIVVLAGLFLVLMMTVFSSASVLITPKTQDVSVTLDVSGTRSVENESVAYEVVKLSRKETVQVPATGEESVELKSRGKIVVYNNFSSEPQRLIARTRFESPEGLVYRIPESVVVPGSSTKNGVSTPGSVEVEVFADEPGEKYNIKKTDFTIPGFKNDSARYKGFYARSSTEMAGGFVGKMKTVLPEEKEKALLTAESQAKQILEKDISSKIPEGLVLLSGSISYESSELPQSEESSGVLIGKDVTAYAVLLNGEQLSKKIVSEYADEVPGWINIPASIHDFSSLNITNSIDKNSLETGGSITFAVAGSAKFVANLDTQKIKDRLLGTEKKEAAKLIEEFPGISSVKVTLRPMWKRSFPDSASKISVEAVLE